MPFDRTINAYEPENVRLAESALLEVAATLQAYRDAMVLIGGWVPFLLLKGHQDPTNPFRHVGSIDSDWAIDSRKIGLDQYDTIVRLLEKRGFSQSPESRYRYVKEFRSPGGPPVSIAVDFLTEMPPRGQGARRRHRRVQRDLDARASQGARIALAHNETIDIDGNLPQGGYLKLQIRLADVAGCVGTKGLALGRRFQEKDCYDLYAVVANYGRGPAEVASIVKPCKREPDMEEALGKVREWFGSIDAVGPVSVGNFFQTETGEARSIRIRAAFENLETFLRLLDRE